MIMIIPNSQQLIYFYHDHLCKCLVLLFVSKQTDIEIKMTCNPSLNNNNAHYCYDWLTNWDSHCKDLEL